MNLYVSIAKAIMFLWCIVTGVIFSRDTEGRITALKIQTKICKDGTSFLNKLRNFNEIFRKNVTYDHIKSHKKPGLNPFSEKHISGNTTDGRSN